MNTSYIIFFKVTNLNLQFKHNLQQLNFLKLIIFLISWFYTYFVNFTGTNMGSLHRKLNMQNKINWFSYLQQIY